MLHCAVSHWGALSSENLVGVAGWVKNYQMTTLSRFLGVVEDMRLGRRPIERGALVVAGAVFPNYLTYRQWFIEQLRKSDSKMAIAAAYALAPHLDQSEELSMRLTVESMKRPRTDPDDSVRVAIQLVLSIWLSSKGTGKCEQCGKTAT